MEQSGKPTSLSRRTSDRPTMRDVAAMAEVSLKTVSRVVNEEPTVNPELAGRVRAAIEHLGYQPDHAARSLRRLDGRSRTIAAVLDDLANPFSAALHRAAVDEARAKGVLVLSASSDHDPAAERQAVMAFLARRVDGIILMPSAADASWLSDALVDGTQAVTVDRPFDGFDAIVSDNQASAARATEHLVRRGHRRIGFLGDLRNIYTAEERMTGYRTALKALDGAVNEHMIRQDVRGREQAEQATIDMLTGTDPPTALFSSQNLITIGAVRALHKLGLQHDVALIGFDDIEFGDLVDPGITVLTQDPTEMGRAAATQLLARVYSGDETPARVHVVPTRLVPRGSGEIRRAG